MLVGIVEVGYGGIDVAGSAGAEVGGDSGELLGIAGYEKEAGSRAGPDAAGGFGDAGGGAEDEDLARGLVLRGAWGLTHMPGLSGLGIGSDALPEAGGEHGVAVAGELLPLWIE